MASEIDPLSGTLADAPTWSCRADGQQRIPAVSDWQHSQRAGHGVYHFYFAVHVCDRAAELFRAGSEEEVEPSGRHDPRDLPL